MIQSVLISGGNTFLATVYSQAGTYLTFFIVGWIFGVVGWPLFSLVKSKWEKKR